MAPTGRPDTDSTFLPVATQLDELGSDNWLARRDFRARELENDDAYDRYDLDQLLRRTRSGAR